MSNFFSKKGLGRTYSNKSNVQGGCPLQLAGKKPDGKVEKKKGAVHPNY